MSSFDDPEEPGIIRHIRSLFSRDPSYGSSVAVGSASGGLTTLSSTASSPSTIIYTTTRQLNAQEVDQIRADLIRQLESEGRLQPKQESNLRPMDEERRKRKIDTILEDAKDD